MLLDRLEQAIEGVFDRWFGQAPPRIQPRAIAAAMLEASERGRVSTLEGSFLPNRFAVRLSQDDLETTLPVLEELTRELREFVGNYTRETNSRVAGPVKITWEQGRDLNPGETDVSAEILAGPCPASLTVIQGPDAGGTFQLVSPVTRIGRAEENDIALQDSNVSRQHCEVRSSQLGFEAVDLGSTNGVLLNGQLITRAPLADGDLLELGRTIMRFELP